MIIHLLLCFLWSILLSLPIPSVATARPQLQPLPSFDFEGSPSQQPLITRLRNLPPAHIQRMRDLIGSKPDLRTIHILLVENNSPLAHQVPPWIVGYAQGVERKIVLLPDRVRSYPYGSLELVFLHEVAHVFISQAAQGQFVPRWFDEGLAMVSSDPWDLEDQARFLWTMFANGPRSFQEIDTLFHQDADSTKQAYVLSGAVVRYLIAQQGSTVPSRILSQLAQRRTFPQAFSQVMGQTIHAVEADFFTQQSFWSRWGPLLTSGGTLWVGMILLVFLALWVQRKRAQTIKKKWDEEDGDLL